LIFIDLLNFMSQERKKELKKKQTGDHALLKKTGLDIDLVNEHEDDIKLAKLLAHKKGTYLAFRQTKMHISYLYLRFLYKCFLFRYKENRRYGIETISLNRAI